MVCCRMVTTILIVSTLGCATPPMLPAEVPSQQLQYYVAPPDVLMISVRPTPEITRTVTIRPDGRISFDLIGELEVQGKTVEEIQREIASRMEEYIVHPDVTVILSQSNSRQYFVFGEVMRRGAYPLIGRVDAVGALASAGGPTRFAKMGAARLVRPTEALALAYRVDFEEIARRGDASTNYELQAGDIIYVPPRMFAQIGYEIGLIFFPLQQILSPIRAFVRPATMF